MSYRDELVQRIKEAGQELIDRAENMVDKEVDYITDFDIYINLHPEGDCVEIPTIQWNTTVANRNTLKRKWGRMTPLPMDFIQRAMGTGVGNHF